MFDIKEKYSILSNYLDRAISLENMGINDVCWTYDDVNEIIDYLCEHNCIILGGDVLIKRNNELLYTYDNWYIEREPDKLYGKKYIETGRRISKKYINDYVMANGKNFYFVIVYESL